MHTAFSTESLFSFPLAMGQHNTDDQPEPNREPITGSALFSQSVVGAMGVGNFVYAIGSSGKRYVFSAVKAGQAKLYDNALFAGGVQSANRMTISTDAELVSGEKTTLFVHIVQGCHERGNILDDLLTVEQ